jgi:hypothetical protein
MATARGEYRFTVRESADGVPWLAAEPNNERDPWLNSVLGFELRRDTTREEAEGLARVLNGYVVAIGLI